MTDTTVDTALNHEQQNPALPNQLPIFVPYLIRKHGRGVLFWAIGVTLYTIAMVLSFPAFEDTGTLDVSQYPEGMREAFNLQSLDTIEPFLSSQVYNFLPLVLMFVPITIFAGAIAGSEERGTLDILFGNPLPRPTYVVAYWLAVALLMLAMLLVLGGGSWLAAVLIGVELSFSESMLAALNLFPITMAAGGLALLISARFRQRALAIGIPAALMFLMYMVDIIGKIAETYAPLRNLSAFKAYGDVLQDGMPWIGASLLLVVALVFAVAAIPLFQHRDIYT